MTRISLRLGERLAVQIADKIKKRAVNSLLNRNRFNIQDLLLGDYVKILAKSMLHSHLIGLKRTRRKSIRADQLDNVINVLTQQLNIENVAQLEQLYETRALRVLQGVADKVEVGLRTKLNDLISTGTPTAAAKRSLLGEFAKLGLAGTSPHTIEAIFRTQTQIALNAGKFLEEQDPVIQEILWGYRYVTVGDDRVRPSHADMDNVTLPKEDPFWLLWYPPNGWNCRCAVIPIFEPRKVIEPSDRLVLPAEDFRFNPGMVFNTGL